VTPEDAKALRDPFPANQVGALPKTTCRDCSKAPTRVCPKHTKRECPTCHNFMTSAHIDLDYVGHAMVTDRLLQVDPGWTWEPIAVDESGAPLVGVRDGEASMWIRLTVCGVTRLGVGSVAANAFDREKQLISDALRNAAMRFGVALDLWSKESTESEPAAAPPAKPARSPRKAKPTPAHGSTDRTPTNPPGCAVCREPIGSKSAVKRRGEFVHGDCLAAFNADTETNEATP